MPIMPQYPFVPQDSAPASAIQQPPSALNGDPPNSTNNSTSGYAVDTTATTPVPTDDDDYEDLYDPEFGIGGNGRRRFRTKKAATAVGRSGSSSTVSSSGSSMVFSICTRSPRTNSMQSCNGVIPPAAVISTATAACAAGWSTSDALAAATADPSGSFLAGVVQPLSQNLAGNPRGSGDGGGSGVESPDRKSFSGFRRNNPINSLSSGLSLLSGGRRSPGQIFSDSVGTGYRNNHSGIKKFNTDSVDRSVEVMEPITSGPANDKVLSYSQYLAQNHAARAAVEAEATRQNQQPHSMPSRKPLAQTRAMSMGTTTPARAPVPETTITLPPIADNDEAISIQSPDPPTTVPGST
ncbi:hypothetical protein BGX23_011303 [Mortierella sp. AD031]|nr:hypothetical protein BGX23_011303 [Mortierella sp. AD031]